MLTAERIHAAAAELLPTVEATLRQAWMPGDWFHLTEQTAKHYAAKAAIFDAARCGPRLLEVGTRCGYSAAVFRLVCPALRMLCIDAGIDDDSEKCLAHARNLFVQNDIDAQLVMVDTRDIRYLPPADFAHVDGDHSYGGALRDLRLASLCPVILADDYDNANVARAVRHFVEEAGRSFIEVPDGLRVAAVIQ